MTDRELIEAAARAAGIGLKFEPVHGAHWIEPGQGLVIDIWNPLVDDGQALRLAVKLNLHVEIDAESAGVITIEWDFDESGTSRRSVEQEAPMGGDDYAATRRAVVRAAAAMHPVDA